MLKKIWPSNIHRLLECRASLQLPHFIMPSKYADRGKSIHARIEEYFKEGGIVKKDIKPYVDYIKPLIKEIQQDGGSYYLEWKLHDATYPDNISGKPDFFAYNPASKTLEIVDFKTGYRYVNPNHNPQLLFYLYLILQCFEEIKPIRVFTTIIQPEISLDAVSREVNHSQYEKFKQNLELLINEVMTGKTIKYHENAGSHCLYCPSAVYCKGFLKENLGVK